MKDFRFVVTVTAENFLDAEELMIDRLDLVLEDRAETRRVEWEVAS